MQNLEAQKLINKMQRYVIKSGVQPEKLIEDLKALRPYAIEEEDPLLTKVIRMTYEHLEQNGMFDIPIPEDEEVVEGEEEDEEVEPAPKPERPPMDDAQRQESLEYLLEVMTRNQQKVNRLDLTEYKLLFLAYN